jgi:sugar phosphate isomerase/epimerase
MKISLGSWACSFGPYASHPVSFEDLARRLAAAGYDGVEICGFPPHVTIESHASTASRGELRSLLSGLGLGISGYAADFSTVNPVMKGNRERYLDLAKRFVDLCAAIGSPSFRVDTGSAPGSISEEEYPDAAARLADIWRETATFAGSAGVKVLWEFEPAFAFNKPGEIRDLHRRVGHKNFSILFDTAHAYMTSVAGARQHGVRETLKGGPAELLASLGPAVGAVHLNDADGTLYEDETSTHCPFGEGVIDFNQLAPRIKSLQGVTWLCIDLCFVENSWELIGPSLAWVRERFA